MELLVLALAAQSILTAWFQEGGLFANCRGKYEALKITGSKLAKLLTCAECFAYHATFWVVALLWLPAALLPAPWHLFPKAVLYSLAATTIVHWLTRLSKSNSSESKHPEG